MKKITLLLIALMLACSLTLTSCDLSNPYTYTLEDDGEGYSVSAAKYPLVFYIESLVIPFEHNGVAVTSVADGGFAGWDGFFSVIVPGTVKSIGTYAFGSCDALNYVFVGNGTEEIKGYAFANCLMLREIILPATLKKIDTCAFAFCTSLEKITFNGTVSQWNALEKGEGWHKDAGIDGEFAVVCSDGVVAVPGHTTTMPDIEQ